MADIVAAIKLQPNDKNLRAHHAVCKEGKSKATAKEKNAFAKFLPFVDTGVQFAV